MAKVCISDVVGTLSDAPQHVGRYHNDNYYDEERPMNRLFNQYDRYSYYDTPEQRRARDEHERERRARERALARARSRRQGHVATPIYRQLSELLEEMAMEQPELDLWGKYSDIVRDQLAKALGKSGSNRIFSIGEVEHNTRSAGSFATGSQTLLTQGEVIYRISCQRADLERRIARINREATEKKVKERQEQINKVTQTVTSEAMKDFVNRPKSSDDEFLEILGWAAVVVVILFFLLIIVIASH